MRTLTRQNEQITDRVCELYDARKSGAEILSMFSEQERVEVRGILSLLSALEAHGSATDRLVPDEASFQRLLAALPDAPVTKVRHSRYILMQGRMSNLINLMQSAMRMNWKIIAPIAVFIFAVVAYAGGLFGGNWTGSNVAMNALENSIGNDSIANVPENGTDSDSVIGVPENMATSGADPVSSTPSTPTGNINSAVDALLADAAAEDTFVSSDDATVLVDADSQAINNFEQYDAYDF